ncbi:MAG: Jag N-terminal domain-containing protein [Chloroflexi bacterium]|nr:Jag N-terminal domain-containing protein [Chloroflexota bacterium]
MDRVEATGRTVEEAVANALLRLRVDRSAVDIQVLHEGSRGLLGIGAEDARILVTLKSVAEAPVSLSEGMASRIEDVEAAEDARPVRSTRQPLRQLDSDEDLPDTLLDAGEEDEEADVELAVASDELIETALGILQELLELLHLEGEVEVRSRSYPLTINVHGEDLGILIGHHGDTLASLQLLVNLLVSRKMGRWTRVVVDVEEYRLRRERTLRQLAARTAERVHRTRQAVTLEPMPSNERRVVHLALQGDRYVSTHSVGEGDNRKVVISPRSR